MQAHDEDLSESISSLLEKARRSPAHSHILHRVKRMLLDPPLSRVKRTRRSTYGEPALVRVKRVDVEQEEGEGLEAELTRVKRQKRGLRDQSLGWLNRKRRAAEGQDVKALRKARRERRKAAKQEKELQRTKRMHNDVQVNLKKVVKRMMRGSKEDFRSGLRRLRSLRKSLKRSMKAESQDNTVEK